jgi:hypothetical protein
MAPSSIPKSWREDWLDKPYRHLSPYDLIKQRPDALKGVSEADSARMNAAFGINTLEDFATQKYFGWAQELVSLKMRPSDYKKENFAEKLDKRHSNKDLAELLKSPPSVLNGVSDADSKNLQASFNTKTVEELGSLKFISWANIIYDMARNLADRQIPSNWREQWLDKPHQNLSPKELLAMPPDALKGVSEADSARLREAFNIKTLNDFATLKYLEWAQALAFLRDDPGAFRKEDYRDKLDKEYENKTLDEILKAPTSALQGVSDADHEKLLKSFNTRTVEELGNLKYYAWARGIYEMAQRPHVFKVGDRVKTVSGSIGIVTFASEPDMKGVQKVEVGVES